MSDERPDARPDWARALPRELCVAVGAGAGRRARLAVAADRAAALEGAGFGPDGGEQTRASDLSGRRPLGALDVRADDGRSVRLLVRRYEHGGLLRWLTGDRFADASRPFREFGLAEELRAQGLPTARVVAARARPAPLVGWHLDLVTERVEGAVDVGSALEAVRANELCARARHALASAVGRFVARAHALGLAHADLQPRNLLVSSDALARGAPLDVVAIDLDRSRLAPRLAAGERRSNLARLVRAVRRRESRGAPFLARTDLARAARAYARSLTHAPGVALDPADWRTEYREVAAALARSMARHRLGWWLERLAGARPERRDGAARVRRP